MATTTAGTTLTIPEAANFARQAGWSGNALITLLAIAISESGLNTHAINPHDPYGGSFGILQINGAHFGRPFGPLNGPDMYVMSQSAAFDPYLSFLYAQPLSNYGRDFSPWGSYKNLSYLTHIDAVRQQLNGGGGGTTFPAYTGTPWYKYGVHSDLGYGNPPSTYDNTDVGTPVDTPITAPLAGTITTLGYFDWGGQVTWKVDNPSAINGYKDVFVIHLDAINPNLAVGQHINVGDFLGYSGGQLSNTGLPPLPGGLQHHVTLPSHSSGPHLDIGVGNTPDVSLDASKAASDMLVQLALVQNIPYSPSGANSTQTTNPPGSGSIICQMFPWACPSGVPPTTGGAGNVVSQQVHYTLVQYPGFFGICKAIDEAEQFPGFINEVPADAGLSDIGGTVSGALQSIGDTIIGNSIPVFVRAVLLIAGIFLIVALLWQLAKPNLEALPALIQLQGSSAALAAA